jgi:hypothetical protein
LAGLKDFFKTAYEQILNELRDLSYVEVITAAGDPYVNLDTGKENIIDALQSATVKPKILARTKIELDGDIFMIIPTQNDDSAKIEQDVLAIHKENVDAAIANWNQFMNTILQAIKVTAEIAGITKTPLDNINFDIKSPGKP